MQCTTLGKRLYLVAFAGQKERLVCMNEAEQIAALRHCQDNSGTGCHFGVNITQAEVVESYYWHGITQDVKNWVSNRFQS